MVKRKFPSESENEVKRSSTEESGEGMDDSGTPSAKSRRVRKKSTKLIEMEEFEEEVTKVVKPAFSVLPRFGKLAPKSTGSPSSTLVTSDAYQTPVEAEKDCEPITITSPPAVTSVPAMKIIPPENSSTAVTSPSADMSISGNSPCLSPVLSGKGGKDTTAAKSKIKSKASISGKVVDDLPRSPKKPKIKQLITTPLKCSASVNEEDDDDGELPASVIQLLLSSPTPPRPTSKTEKPVAEAADEVLEIPIVVRKTKPASKKVHQLDVSEVPVVTQDKPHIEAPIKLPLENTEKISETPVKKQEKSKKSKESRKSKDIDANSSSLSEGKLKMKIHLGDRPAVECASDNTKSGSITVKDSEKKDKGPASTKKMMVGSKESKSLSKSSDLSSEKKEKKPKSVKLESLDDHAFANILQSGDIMPEKIVKKKPKKKSIIAGSNVAMTNVGVTASFKDDKSLKSLDPEVKPEKTTKSSDIKKHDISVKPEPIVKQEVVKPDLSQSYDACKPEPIHKQDPISKPEPIHKQDHISKPEPIHKQDPISKPEPIHKQDPISKPEPVKKTEIFRPVPKQKHKAASKLSKHKDKPRHSISGDSEHDDGAKLVINEEKKKAKFQSKSPKPVKLKKQIKSVLSSPEPMDISFDSPDPDQDDSDHADNERDIAQLAMKLKTSKEKKAIKRKKKGANEKEDKKKKKKKRAPTAYTMFCSSYRTKVIQESPGIDFAHMSRTLGDMWKALTEKDRMWWRNKARKSMGQGSTLISTGKVGGSRTGPPIPTASKAITPKAVSSRMKKAASPTVVPAPVVDDTPLKIFGSDPIDVAAHLKLLGESLSIIGMRLQEHKGLIAVQGSLSVLLDSVLCAFGPLLCLTQALPETNGCSSITHSNTLDNIAYIMPGL